MNTPCTIKLLVTFRRAGVQRQQSYNCTSLGHASEMHERIRKKLDCVRIETLATLDDWRADHG